MDKNRIFPFALIFLFICKTALGCNTDWILHQEKCYKFITTAEDDFRMARRYCQVYKADLAKIDENSTFIMAFEELFPLLREFVGVVGGQQIVFLERPKRALLDSCLEKTLAIPFVRFLPRKGNPTPG
ncbi:hypothetical protein TNCV_4580641 [Trichonephila clavipes]|nr:hypothetical protein TNCV_4580641 [Trichonephila clavipes]